MKTWEKPELVVLTRSKPEEAVLGFCKQYRVDTGPDTTYAGFGCDSYIGACNGDCSALTFS